MKAAFAEEGGDPALVAEFAVARAHDFMEDDDIEDNRLVVRGFVEKVTAFNGAA